MKRRSRLIIIVVIACMSLFHSCRQIDVVIDSEEKRAFLNSASLGLYRGGVDVLIYNPAIHQKSTNVRRNSFRIQTDNQDEYVHAELESFPKNTGVHIMTYFIYHSLEKGKDVSATFLFECSKMTEKYIWLWDSEDKIGLIITLQ